ncbi:MAG TPA: hypothetical protein VN814_23705, partial [Caulobacteraceae bacterium]|nr:hypothetical protein [Caulobacteraceae bacterium]
MQRPTSERDYIAADFDLGLGSPECDLILKGGLTSGVVYPYAILEIAKKYRLRSVGGTSVGAIAAGFAAAAEFARRSGCPQGFIRLQERCDALPARLSSLFQPDPALRVLYEAGFAMTKKDRKVLNVLWAVRGLIAVGAGLGAGIYLVLTWVIALAFNEPLWGASATPGLLIAILTG